MQWSFVSFISYEHRGWHSAWDQLRGSCQRISQEKSSKSFTTLVLKTTVTIRCMLSWPVVSGVTLLIQPTFCYIHVGCVVGMHKPKQIRQLQWSFLYFAHYRFFLWLVVGAPDWWAPLCNCTCCTCLNLALRPSSKGTLALRIAFIARACPSSEF